MRGRVEATGAWSSGSSATTSRASRCLRVEREAAVRAGVVDRLAAVRERRDERADAVAELRQHRAHLGGLIPARSRRAADRRRARSPRSPRSSPRSASSARRFARGRAGRTRSRSAPAPRPRRAPRARRRGSISARRSAGTRRALSHSRRGDPDQTRLSDSSGGARLGGRLIEQPAELVGDQALVADPSERRKLVGPGLRPAGGIIVRSSQARSARARPRSLISASAVRRSSSRAATAPKANGGRSPVITPPRAACARRMVGTV